MLHQSIARSVVTLCCVIAVSSGAVDLDAMIKDCEGCHGANGVSESSDMPTIAGLSAGSHEDAMYAYLDGARPCEKSKYRHGDTSRAATDMCAVAKKLSEDDIAALAEHFAEKKFVPMKQEFDAEKAGAGESLHNKNCKRCHTDGGSNPDDDASILAGQPLEYLIRTFAEYSSGERDQPKKMKSKMDPLSEADFEALSHYYASQQ